MGMGAAILQKSLVFKNSKIALFYITPSVPFSLLLQPIKQPKTCKILEPQHISHIYFWKKIRTIFQIGVNLLNKTQLITFVSSNSTDGEVYLTHHYMIKFVNDLWQVGGFLRVLRFPPPIKLSAKDITEILLKEALNTIILTRM